MKTALGIALILGMLFAGIVTIAHSRNERWDQIRQWNAVERYRRLWFNTTFALELDHLILFRAKDVYSRALYNTKEGNKDAKEIYKTFEFLHLAFEIVFLLIHNQVLFFLIRQLFF